MTYQMITTSGALGRLSVLLFTTDRPHIKEGCGLFLGVPTRFYRKHHKAKTIDHRVVRVYVLESSDHKLYRNIKIIPIDGTSQKFMASLI